MSTEEHRVTRNRLRHILNDIPLTISVWQLCEKYLIDRTSVRESHSTSTGHTRWIYSKAFKTQDLLDQMKNLIDNSNPYKKSLWRSNYDKVVAALEDAKLSA